MVHFQIGGHKNILKSISWNSKNIPFKLPYFFTSSKIAYLKKLIPYYLFDKILLRMAMMSMLKDV